MKAAIARAMAKQDATAAQMAEAFGQIMDGKASEAQIAGLLVALACKGETAEEIAGAARAMRERVTPLVLPAACRAVDTCGTGGDNSGAVNISTLAAMLVAACGGVVAKHGNRALSSKAGSADVLEALGVTIALPPAGVAACITQAQIGFAFAPNFHSATKHAAAPRKELGVRTMFNLLGPLTNPAAVKYQVVGVFAAPWCVPMAAALGALGAERAMVVHGAGGLDEFATAGATQVALWSQGGVTELTTTPASFGLPEEDPAGLAGGDAAFNAVRLREVLAGVAIAPGEANAAIANAAAMTAGAALALLDVAALDLASLPRFTAQAMATLRDGAAQHVLQRWAAVSQTATALAPQDEAKSRRPA